MSLGVEVLFRNYIVRCTGLGHGLKASELYCALSNCWTWWSTGSGDYGLLCRVSVPAHALGQPEPLQG